ncbi:MAG: carbonic anhydrase [Phenylobacterium sp.]|uniref:carbonic anhydrase n=1 Tax=Phenylobacterium sp. TaxID=1871053 RepID=UPI0017937E71|nr:carbonic anhydrase [Phenylobacterium sp.]MBA4794819.1 carbonic anhydrase [Phenylobacterium sp.]
MIADLFENNLRWAAARNRADPEYFRRLAGQQSPEYLWIGCSDSRVPANEIVGLNPGELFVHRNVANLAPAQDANFLSVLQFAVEVLKVRHVIVCGHYGCGGVRAALSEKRHGLIDHWLSPVRTLSWRCEHELATISDPEARVNDLCERNVIEQVRNIAANPFVRDAWRRKQPLEVHGWIYSIQDGLLRDLDVSVGRLERARALAASDRFHRRQGRRP